MVKRTPTPLRLSTKKRFGSLQRGIRQAMQVLLSTFCIYKLYYANCRQNVTFVYRASALKASAAAQIC